MASNAIRPQPAPPQPYSVPESTPYSPTRISELRWSEASAAIKDGWDREETEKPIQTRLETKEPTPTSLDRGSFRNAVDRPDSSSWKDIDLGSATQAVGALTIL